MVSPRCSRSAMSAVGPHDHWGRAPLLQHALGLIKTNNGTCGEVGFSAGIRMEGLNSFEISVVPKVSVETTEILVLGRFGGFQLERCSEEPVEYVLEEKRYSRSVSPAK